ncbi:hypothetical protein DCAR_0416387 [Daucus carota subsp. sativus]|uniref:Pentatricopeptide repeat-containing protein n=1 Tax=Daucus carota subsp. sativus TaxID=79200 RepID=A0A165XF07_DAUCS|nr:PREDICTED: pentatricopeptide repeat-containing protein At1g09410-like [Daucus carota subsp. sativus]WOG97048.1 hypothetical protein DCAR_0416387 [Daucus carota subsp. sativus]
MGWGVFGKLKIQKWGNLRRFCTRSCDYNGYDVFARNIEITRWVKSGNLMVARKVFDEMPDRTVVSWNIMVSGYSRFGRFGDALSMVSAMHVGGVKLNETTFASALSACARLPSLCGGKQVHCVVVKSGSEDFRLVGSALLYIYASCFEIEDARQVFDLFHEMNELLWGLMLVGYVQCSLMDNALDVFYSMPIRDVIAWTSVISGYCKIDDGCGKALQLFNTMRGSGEAKPNEFTLDPIIRACARVGLLHEGRAFHGLVMRYGYEFEHSISAALIGFYCDCDVIDDAKKVFDRLTSPSLNETNVFIEKLIAAGRIVEAELIFNGLPERNTVSYNLMIKGYSLCGRSEDSEKLYLEMHHRTILSSNIMISVYSRTDQLEKAVDLFEKTKEEKNPVTWNSMISGYIRNDQHENALKLYAVMHKNSISKTRSTYSALFHSCSCLGSIQLGQLLHAHLIKTPFVSNVYVGTALVDMYSKCGNISNAQKSFISISSPSVAAWTALIHGYAHNGFGSETILCFKEMINQGVHPNAATFVAVLSACAHAGFINKGIEFFHIMKENYGIAPSLEHFTCLVDLLGRSGRLREAEELIKEMPVEADGIIWGALLNACWFWMDMDVGERVAAKMLLFFPIPTSTYIIMSNIYAMLGKWEEKMKVRKLLRGLDVKKDPGCSWIELNNSINVFSVEDRTHPSCNSVYAMLEHLTENLISVRK